MARKALTREQLNRLCECAPAVMGLLDGLIFLEHGKTHAGYLTFKIVNYIENGGKIPDFLFPAESE
ncbi:MAG: hypothetical protein IJT21_10075 [Synergistaceae bacterium]|nr:hypothetical protein [Synergistaceae bacterium]